MKKIVLFIGLLLSVSGTLSHASDKEAEKEKEPSQADHFRCERFQAENLAMVKTKLLANCDLKLPFSFSTPGDFLNSKTNVIYCCNTK